MVELMQVQTGRGPCVRCYMTGRPVHVHDLTAPDPRWPELASVADHAGYRAAHTVPLRLRRRTLGAVNLFYARPGPAAEGDLRLAQALADVAALAMLHEPAVQNRPEDVLSQMQATLTHKAAIEQAKGILAVRGELSVEDAGLLLRVHAHQRRRPVTEVACALVRGEMPADDVLAARDAPENEARMPRMLTLTHSPMLCCRTGDIRGDRIVVEVIGDLDLDACAEFDAILTAYADSAAPVLLNMAAVDFINCAALRVVLLARQHDRRVCFIAPSPAVIRLLELSDVEVPSYDTVEQALASLAASPHTRRP